MDYADVEEAPRGRAESLSKSPERPQRREMNEDRSRSRSPERRRERAIAAPPLKPRHAPANPEPTNVVGVFGLSLRTTEEDLNHEFGRIAPLEKATIVYDARSGQSRGFAFINMRDVEGATAVIKELNGIDLHGRRLRVDYSVTRKPHDPTPGQYRGEIRRDEREGRRPPPGAWGPPGPGGPWGRGPPPPPYGGYPPYPPYGAPPPTRGWGPDADPDWRRRSPPRRRRSFSRENSPPRRRNRDYDEPRSNRDEERPRGNRDEERPRRRRDDEQEPRRRRDDDGPRSRYPDTPSPPPRSRRDD